MTECLQFCPMGAIAGGGGEVRFSEVFLVGVWPPWERREGTTPLSIEVSFVGVVWRGVSQGRPVHS